MTIVTFSFEDVSSDDLVVLGRHICRIANEITLQSLREYLPGLSSERAREIVRSLLTQTHIVQDPTRNDFYKFSELDRKLDLGDVDEEFQVLEKVKNRILNIAESPNTMMFRGDSGLIGTPISFVTKDAICSTPVKLEAESSSENIEPLQIIMSSLSASSNDESNTLVAQSSFEHTTIDGAQRTRQTMVLQSIADELVLDGENDDGSTTNDRRTSLSSQMLSDGGNQVSALDCVNIFCQLQKLPEPIYTTTYLPESKSYFCMLQLGGRSFHSHPIEAASGCLAMQISAEKAVLQLGLTPEYLRQLLESFRVAYNIPEIHSRPDTPQRFRKEHSSKSASDVTYTKLL